MASARMSVCYFGEQWDGQELADFAEIKFITFFRRWERAGKPFDITLIGGLLSPKWVCPRAASILIKHDGYCEELPLLRAAEMYGVSENCIRDRIKKYGTTLTTDKLQVDKQRQASGAKSKGKCSRVRFDSEPRRPAKSEVVTSSAGWAELKYFPNAGQYGFCKAPIDNFSGTSSSGFPVYTGKQ